MSPPRRSDSATLAELTDLWAYDLKDEILNTARDAAQKDQAFQDVSDEMHRLESSVSTLKSQLHVIQQQIDAEKAAQTYSSGRKGKGRQAENTRSRGGSSRLENLRGHRADLQDALRDAREVRDTRLPGLKQDSEGMASERRWTFYHFANATNPTVGRGQVSLLPETSIAYARALAGYGGDWPPTRENLAAHLKSSKARTAGLRKAVKVAQAKMAKPHKDTARNAESQALHADLVGRSKAIGQEVIDFSLPPVCWYYEPETRDLERFNDVVAAEARLRLHEWEVARTAERSARSTEKPYSTLGGTLVTRGTQGSTDDSYLRSLMDVPEAVEAQDADRAGRVNGTVSAVWTSPAASYTWYGPSRRPPMGGESSESEPEPESDVEADGGISRAMGRLAVTRAPALANDTSKAIYAKMKLAAMTEDKETATVAMGNIIDDERERIRMIDGGEASEMSDESV